MLTSIEGIYRDGKVELIGPVPLQADGRVIITFLDSATDANATDASAIVTSAAGASANDIDLAARGIGSQQAEDLRQRLSTIAEDWQRPDMDVYDAV